MNLSLSQTTSPFYTVEAVQQEIESIYNTKSIFLKELIVDDAKEGESVQYKQTCGLLNRYYFLEERIEKILHVFQENRRLDLNENFKWCLDRIQLIKSERTSPKLALSIIRLTWHILIHALPVEKSLKKDSTYLLNKWLFKFKFCTNNKEQQKKLVGEILLSRIPSGLSVESKNKLIFIITDALSSEELSKSDLVVLRLSEGHTCFCSKMHLKQSSYFRKLLEKQADFYLDLKQDQCLNQCNTYFLYEYLDNRDSFHTKKLDREDFYQLYRLCYTLECPLSFFNLNNSSEQIETSLSELEKIINLKDEPIALLLEIGYRENRPILIQNCVKWLINQSIMFLPEGEKIVRIKIEGEKPMVWFAPTQWLMQQSIYCRNFLDDIGSKKGRIIELDLYENNFPEPYHEMSQLFLEWLQRESDFPIQKIDMDNFAIALTFQQFFELPEEVIQDQVRSFFREISMPVYLTLARSYPIIRDYIIPITTYLNDKTVFSDVSLRSMYWQILARHFLKQCNDVRETPINILMLVQSELFNASCISNWNIYFLNAYLFKQKIELSNELEIELEIDYEDFDIVELEYALKNFSETYFDRLEAEIGEYKYLKRRKDPKAAAVLETMYEDMRIMHYSFSLLFQENKIGDQIKLDFTLLNQWMKKVEEILQPRANDQKTTPILDSRIPQSRKLRNFCESFSDTSDAYLIKFSHAVCKTAEIFTNIIKKFVYLQKEVVKAVITHKWSLLTIGCVVNIAVFYEIYFPFKGEKYFTAGERAVLDKHFKHIAPKILRDIYPTVYAVSKTESELFMASVYPVYSTGKGNLNVKAEDLFKNFTKGIYKNHPIFSLSPTIYNPDYVYQYLDSNPNNPFKFSFQPIDKDSEIYLKTDFENNKSRMNALVNYNIIPLVKAYICKINLKKRQGRVDLDTPLDCSTLHYNASKKQKKKFIQILIDRDIDNAPYVQIIENKRVILLNK